MTLHGKSLIAGQPTSTGGTVHRAINPATAAALDPDFHEALPSEVDAAVNAAAAAFDDFRARPAEQRARLLQIADMCPVHRTLHSEIQVVTSLRD